MILYPLVYGSFPWSGGYDFHPSNIGRDGKTLKIPFDTSNISKGDIESVLRQCSSESWFTRRLSNDWFLIGHTYNSIDAHNRPSSIVYSLLVPPDIIDTAGGIPDPHSLVMDWEPDWTGSEPMAARNIMSKGHYVVQKKRNKGSEEAPKTNQKKQRKLPWKLIAVIAGSILCVGLLIFIVSEMKPKPAPPAIPPKPTIDIQTKNIFEWYVSNFKDLPPQYRSLQKYHGKQGYVDIPEDKLPVGDFREHLSNLMTFLIGDRFTVDGLNKKLSIVIDSLSKPVLEKIGIELASRNLSGEEKKRLHTLMDKHKKQFENMEKYFRSQVALVAFIQGLSYKEGDFEQALVKEHHKYHIKYIRASTTFDSRNIPARLNALLKQAQKEKKDKGAEIASFLENMDHPEIAQLQSLRSKTNNILKFYIHN